MFIYVYWPLIVAFNIIIRMCADGVNRPPPIIWITQMQIVSLFGGNYCVTSTRNDTNSIHKSTRTRKTGTDLQTH